MAPTVAIIFYSTYGHIATMAESVKAGVEAAGGAAKIFQIPETLSQEILTKMHAPAKRDYPTITPSELTGFDGFLLGIPTRYGNFPAQWKAFWDATGQLWGAGALHGKYAGTFVSTGTLGGGQETTCLHTIGTLTHHGIIYVPLGYKHTMEKFGSFAEIHGSSPWGAGTFAGLDGSRQPSELELEIAKIQGENFYKTLLKVSFEKTA